MKNFDGLLRALLSAALILTSFALEKTTSAQSTSSSSASDRGRSTFIAKGCADCHAVYDHGVGQTEPKGGPDLGERGVYGTYLELAATMWNHFPKMLKKVRKKGQEFPSFTEADVGEIISFLSYIRYTGEPGRERTGRKLLREKQCTKCHTFGGQGGDIGPDFTQGKDYLSPLALAAAMWNHGPGMIDLFEENDIDRPKLEGHEMVDLAVGIRSFMSPSRIPVGSMEPGNPESGRLLAVEKGCQHCHASSASLGSSDSEATEFADMDFEASLTAIAGEMWNHGPAMWDMMEKDDVTFPSLEATEMANIISYIYELQLQDPPGDVDSGRELIDEKGCISCHSVDAGGAGLATDFRDLDHLDDLVSPLAMISLMWNHVEDMDEAVREKKKRWPEFEGKDLADIHAYLSEIASKTKNQ